MIGPFEFCTTASSGERAGVAGAGAGALAVSGVFGGEHPVSNALADAARTVCPNTLRLRFVGATTLRSAGRHVPQPLVLQSPQSLTVLPITLSNSLIALTPFEKALIVSNPDKPARA